MDKREALIDLAVEVVATESSRTDALHSKSEKVIAAVGLISGFEIVDFGRTQAQVSAGPLGLILFLVPLLVLAGALAGALLSMRVMDARSYPTRDDLLEVLDIDSTTDGQVAHAISRLHLSVRDKNAMINDKRARQLAASGRLLIVGFVLALASSFLRHL